ncbi:uncharacterized protein METZ01_LOCUS104583 [marine metagenome]|uniref:Uncharacterized protein n=1 Tax=marine metagenome TaxID=408172 RepID=A0A381WGX1_9ZZZZ
MAVQVDNFGSLVKTPTGQIVTTARAAGAEAVRISGDILNSAHISPNGVLSSVEGAVTELKSAIAGVDNFTNFSNNVGGQSAVSTAGQGHPGDRSGAEPPWENELEKFVSYSSIFTLSCLTTEDLNLPDFSYRQKPPEHIILRSGGTGGDKVKTLQESGTGPPGGMGSGAVEYYIDDVEIESVISHNKATRQSRAVGFTFKVFEPYSMGMFNETLQVAAIAAGHKNYLVAPYLLSVKFVGWDDDGNSQQAKNSERHFPVKLVGSEFSVTEQGSTYEVTAVPYNHKAFADKTQQVKTDLSLKGSTVKEILQTGAESLATVLNTRLLKSQEAKQIPKADKYVIMFPTKNSSRNESMLGGTSDTTAGATTSVGEGTIKTVDEKRKQELFESVGGLLNSPVPADFQAKIDQLLGITITRSEVGEAIRTFAEKPGNVNPIGKSKMVKAANESGNVPFTAANTAKVDNQKPQPPGAPGFTPVCRSKCQISPDVRTFQFPPGKKIQDIIEEVVLASEWGRSIKDRMEQPDQYNMVDWFKIDAQVYNIADSKTVDAKGDSPKVFVYRVLPYKVSASKWAAPSKAQPDLTALNREAAKEYNYIYTGENKDILDFDIRFDAAYYVAIGAARGQNTAAEKKAGQAEMVAGPFPYLSKSNTGDSDKISKSGSAQVDDTHTNSTGKSGGGGKEHVETQLARNFNDAVIDSPADLIQVELKIWGDPYYLADSGMGNYIAEPTSHINITKDGSMNYENCEVDVRLNFRTPFDYGDEGFMEFPSIGQQPVKAFSGLYQVIQVASSWSGGEFTQNLTMIRRRNQEVDMKSKGTKGGNALITQGTKENKIDNDPGTAAAIYT